MSSLPANDNKFKKTLKQTGIGQKETVPLATLNAEITHNVLISHVEHSKF